jgi:hypothetical protein
MNSYLKGLNVLLTRELLLFEILVEALLTTKVVNTNDT